MKMKGDYMKPFNSFYDPKAMDPPLSQQQIERYEKNIYKDLEIAIRQTRSSKNLVTKIKKNDMFSKILKMQLDFIEDIQCERITNKE